jgi:hypothetical protein
LVKDPGKRLGARGDSAEIKRHLFFQDIDWQALYSKKLSPPFVPSIVRVSPTCLPHSNVFIKGSFIFQRDATDVVNFDKEFTSESATLSPNSSVLRDADQDEFHGFTFIRTKTTIQNQG